MPVLAKEVSVYPSSLFEEPAEDDSERQWWAVYTKSRQEKAVARQLLGHHVPFFLPLMPKDKVAKGRRSRSHVPMFGGYIFLFGTDEERVTTLQTNRISRILPVVDQEQLWCDLRNLNELIEADVSMVLESRLAVGQRVRIKSGSLKGLEGAVIKRHSKCRLLVAVKYLQQGVSIEIDDCAVEPL